MSLSSQGEPAIRADSLIKTYGAKNRTVNALNGLSFTVMPGTLFALLGPNGAGKSTTVKILTTLTRADSGTAMVAGHEVNARPERVRASIGYVSQKPSFDPIGTGLENLIFQGRVYGMSQADAKARASSLLDRFGLSDAAGRLVQKWSGGMQRKLDVAMGLIHRPEVIFLDEPTTGLDPEARSELWQEIARLSREDALTVLFTTHYLDEADHVAEQMVIVDHGRIVAEGTPESLKAELDGDAVTVEVDHDDQARTAAGVLAGLSQVRDLAREGGLLHVRVTNGAASLPPLMAALEEAAIPLASITVSRPSLDDVYLRHAGRSFRATGAREPAVAELEEVAR